MKGTILASIPDGAPFRFGGVAFVKLFRSELEEEDMIMCHIVDTTLALYISACAWVEHQSEREII